ATNRPITPMKMASARGRYPGPGSCRVPSGYSRFCQPTKRASAKSSRPEIWSLRNQSPVTSHSMVLFLVFDLAHDLDQRGEPLGVREPVFLKFVGIQVLYRRVHVRVCFLELGILDGLAHGVPQDLDDGFRRRARREHARPDVILDILVAQFLVRRNFAIGEVALGAPANDGTQLPGVYVTRDRRRTAGSHLDVAAKYRGDVRPPARGRTMAR